MGRSEERAKGSKQAALLIKAGYPHGRRRSSPRPNSGGLTMVNAPGSAKFQRYRRTRIVRG